jgi:hypothetical protein
LQATRSGPTQLEPLRHGEHGGEKKELQREIASPCG